MSTKPTPHDELRAAIELLVDAEVAYSWKGNLTDRAEIREVEIERREARLALNTLLSQLKLTLI